MTVIPPLAEASSKPTTLACFENAYAVAVQMRHHTGRPQFVLRTGNPLQPFRVTSNGPRHRRTLVTLVA
jgi:hypothetical protein